MKTEPAERLPVHRRARRATSAAADETQGTRRRLKQTGRGHVSVWGFDVLVKAFIHQRKVSDTG